jgi:hypothetical protein
VDLRERLRALNGGKPLAAAPVIRRAVDPARVLDGQEVATEHGATLVVERRYRWATTTARAR